MRFGCSGLYLYIHAYKHYSILMLHSCIAYIFAKCISSTTINFSSFSVLNSEITFFPLLMKKAHTIFQALSIVSSATTKKGGFSHTNNERYTIFYLIFIVLISSFQFNIDLVITIN